MNAISARTTRRSPTLARHSFARVQQPLRGSGLSRSWPGPDAQNDILPPESNYLRRQFTILGRWNRLIRSKFSIFIVEGGVLKVCIDDFTS